MSADRSRVRNPYIHPPEVIGPRIDADEHESPYTTTKQHLNSWLPAFDPDSWSVGALIHIRVHSRSSVVLLYSAFD